MLVHGYGEPNGALAYNRNVAELAFKIDTSTPSTPFIVEPENILSVKANASTGLYDIYIEADLRECLTSYVNIIWNDVLPVDALFARMRFVEILEGNVWHYQVWAQKMSTGELVVPPSGFFVVMILSDASTP